MGAHLRLGGGGARGLHRNDFFASHLLCTISKDKWGGGGHGVNGGAMTPSPPLPPIVTALLLLSHWQLTYTNPTFYN